MSKIFSAIVIYSVFLGAIFNVTVSNDKAELGFYYHGAQFQIKYCIKNVYCKL